MNRIWILAALVACPLIALAQSGPSSSSGSGGYAPAYQPAVPAPSMTTPYWGGGVYGGGASTAAGSAMNGMSNVISAAGNYNLATSAAAVNMTQAQRNEIQNRQLYTDTYFQMKETNEAYQKAHRNPKPTMEQLTKIARDGVPAPLSASQQDALTGRLAWPFALQDPSFDSGRQDVDQMYAKFATYGGLDYADQMKVRGTIDDLSAKLTAQIRDIPPSDFMACRNFLRSTLFTLTKTGLQ